MSQFDDFNARVERTKKAADREAAAVGSYRPQTDTRGSGIGRTIMGGLGEFLFELVGELVLRLWWLFLLFGSGVVFLSISFGLSLSAAFTLALVIIVGFVFVAAMMSDS